MCVCGKKVARVRKLPFAHKNPKAVFLCFAQLIYLVFSHVHAALGTMMALSILIILTYNFYIPTARATGLWGRFAIMTTISLPVAAASFLVEIAVRILFGVEIESQVCLIQSSTGLNEQGSAQRCTVRASSWRCQVCSAMHAASVYVCSADQHHHDTAWLGHGSNFESRTIRKTVTGLRAFHILKNWPTSARL